MLRHELSQKKSVRRGSFRGYEENVQPSRGHQMNVMLIFNELTSWSGVASAVWKSYTPKWSVASRLEEMFLAGLIMEFPFPLTLSAHTPLWKWKLAREAMLGSSGEIWREVLHTVPGLWIVCKCFGGGMLHGFSAEEISRWVGLE